jgi:hypothetical protein
MEHRVRAGWFVLLGALALSCLGPLPRVHADGMRCGTRLVSDGDPMMEVRNVCGEPDQAVQRVERRVVSRWIQTTCVDARGRSFACGQMVQDSIEVVVDEWMYDFGPRAFVRTVVFEGGRLVRIVTGGYGTKEI